MAQPHLRAVPLDFPASSAEPPATTPPDAPAPRSPQRARANKSLPTDRLKFNAQVELLMRYGRMSGGSKRPIRSEEVAQAQGVAPNTASLNNAFCVESGWLERVGRGQYVATDALIKYNQRTQLDPGNTQAANEFLAESMRSSWYWSALEQYMYPGGGLPKSEALIVLAGAAGAGPEYRPQLEHVLNWLNFVGLTRTVGDRIVAGDLGSPVVAEVLDSDEPPATAPEMEPSMQGTPMGSEGTKVERKDVVLAFNVDFQLTASELSSLSPDQIRALFEAVGSIMALRKDATEAE